MTERDARKAVVGDARSRIVRAGIRCVVRDGLADASMAAIAQEAEVSKALLHYHFADRAQLLAEMVTLIGRRLITREQGTLERDEVSAPVDVLWRWLEVELERGELRALLALSALRDAKVRDAAEEVSTARRTSAAATVEYVFARLGLTARVPLTLIADAIVAFLDGLALDSDSDRDSRVSFDVFWLGILSLGD
ncbi:MAG: regulatory protein TetR [Gemmatimonadetes bacterium]|nr:regulatory protein TetR [Gemmatimonadota bacterium]